MWALFRVYICNLIVYYVHVMVMSYLQWLVKCFGSENFNPHKQASKYVGRYYSQEFIKKEQVILLQYLS